jgi:lysyl-tRNA synthetase, class I
MAEKSKQFYHWTDVIAEKIIRDKGNKDKYVIESGITPSGMIHVGNFREAITADLIRRALEKRGKKVEFLYVWDDYDVLRKVPSNLPKQDMIKENLRKPVFQVPDPFGCHKTYAEHFEKVFEEENERVGIKANFVYSHEHYLKCEYAEEIKLALENTDQIKTILNEFRRKPLADDWLPIFVFCSKCNKDTIKEIKWDNKYGVDYECECGHKETIDFRKQGLVTLRWRVDWPMRWHHNKVDFETAGKDHFAAGGSVTTGLTIQKEVFNSPPPAGVSTNDFYESIGIKGRGQFASSSGNVVTLTEMLEIYEPEIVRYLFAGTRPNREFSISFDTDVLALYEEFDRVERVYFGLEKVNDKKTAQFKAAYELSFIGQIPKTIPYQPGIRHLTTILQIYDFDIDKVVGYFEKELKNEHDKKRLRVRAECAMNWVQKYAPEDFRFKVQEKCLVTVSAQGKKILSELASKLEEKDWTDKELHEEMYILCKNNDFPAGDFFKLAYNVLVNKDKGPRLASFILEIGKEKVAGLFKNVGENKSKRTDHMVSIEDEAK